jgi:hypothetical protein
MANNEAVVDDKPEVVEEIPGAQPAVEYDTFEYQPKDEAENPVGPKQTIKYTKGNFQEALDIMAKNHSESIRSAVKLKQDVLLGRIKREETPVTERLDYTRREFKPRQLTADEQWTIQQNPTSPQSLRLQSQAMYGADPEVVTQTLQEASNDLREWRAKAEAEAFMADTPEWKAYSSLENGVKLCNAILESSRKPTKANYLWAFNMLRESLLIHPVPTVTEVTPPNTLEETVDSGVIPNEQLVTTRRAPTTSGLNNRNSRDTGNPVASRSKWTIDQINKMSGTEYERYFKSEPSFREFVDRHANQLD